MNRFFNPYNFVPTPRRNQPGDHESMRDGIPRGHASLLPGTVSGQLVINMTTESPLLISDSLVVQTNGHKTKKTRTLNGRPEIPVASLKGMIRSAFEIVTNSRYSVFAGHEDRLGMRQPVNDAAKAIPAVVIEKNGKSYLRLLLGPASTRDIAPQTKAEWTSGNRPLAASVKMTELKELNGVTRGSSEVWFTYENKGQQLRVTGIWSNADSSRPANAKKGYLHRTGEAKVKKENERVFFTTEQNPLEIELPDEVRKYWVDLLKNSAVANEDDDERPLYVEEYKVWADLKVGHTCYVRLEGCVDNGHFNGSIELVQPVIIGRQLHPMSPWEILDPSLRPATSLEELSPADRVFGWATQQSEGQRSGADAYAGHLRFGPIKCLTENAVETAKEPATLPTLNSPKPTMTRFYLGMMKLDGSAEPWEPGAEKAATGYRQGATLRGRKVYPHHGSATPQSESFNEPKSKTNYSITDWIKQGSKFQFTIEFRNLNPVELGLLLWSIETLPADGSNPAEHHRLGGAKPLGFGSVSLQLDERSSRVHDSESIRLAWKQLKSPKNMPEVFGIARSEATKVLNQNSSFPHYLAYLSGYENEQVKVSYPRLDITKTDPKGILQWFQENEKRTNRKPLPSLIPAQDNSLEDYANNQNQSRRHR